MEYVPDIQAIAIARGQLKGKLVASVMKQLRSLEIPWTKLSKATQASVIEAVTEDVVYAVNEAVDLIISDDRTRFRASVEQVVFKDGVKAVLLMKNTEASHELADAAGGTVLVVIEDPDRYTSGDDGMPKAEDDQRHLV